jgi:hypothetical protein
MDSLIQKFYYGKEEDQKYTQFGAFSNSLKKPSHNSNYNVSGFIKPNISTINPAMHNMETTATNSQPKTPNLQETFLRPKKLIFNSTTDLLTNNIPKHTFTNDNNLNGGNLQTQNNIPSLHTIKKNFNVESKKNATKMQMMEEKMKNLELKSQRLEVINDFFFDMFENNLVKEELKRQKEVDKKKDKDDKENEEETEQEERPRKKKSKKQKRKKLDIETIDINAKNQEELNVLNFKKKTQSLARNYLNSVKNDIGMFLVEEQLRKNETLQNMAEDILDLKGELLNQIEQMQMIQDLETKKIAYCLQHSGDQNIENLANRIFGDGILKQSDNNNIMSSINNTKMKERGSIFIPRDSLFNTNRQSRRQSINSSGEDKNKTFKQSLFETKDKDKTNEDLTKLKRKSIKSLFDKNNNNEDNKSIKQSDMTKRQSFFEMPKNVIPEEKNENDN